MTLVEVNATSFGMKKCFRCLAGLPGREAKFEILFISGLLALSAVSANAAVVMSGLKNITVSSSTPLQFINLDGAGAAEFALSREMVDFTVSPWLLLTDFSTDFDFVPISPDPGLSDKLRSFSAGTTVGPASSFSPGPDASPNFGVFSDSQGAYFGFRFNPTGNQVLYGWGQLKVSSDNETMTLVQWAYEDSGQAITAPPIPELSSLGVLVLGAGLTTVRRRRL